MFGIPRGNPIINHLAFADDMIILFKDEVGKLKMITIITNFIKIPHRKIKLCQNTEGRKIDKEQR